MYLKRGQCWNDVDQFQKDTKAKDIYIKTVYSNAENVGHYKTTFNKMCIGLNFNYTSALVLLF